MFSRRTFLNTALAAIASIPFLQAERVITLVRPREYVEVVAVVNGKDCAIKGLRMNRRYRFIVESVKDGFALIPKDLGRLKEGDGGFISMTLDFTQQARRGESMRFSNVCATVYEA